MTNETRSLEHHCDYWLDDGSIVFEVGRYLYRIHLSILQKLSPVFRDIFTIPPGRAIQGSAENPIRLEQVTNEEFDDFLLWIYKTNWTPPPRPEQVHVNLLKMCQMWQIDEGTAFAIHQLQQLSLAPSRRLQLARMFSIYDWVRPAVTLLIVGDFTFLSLSDEELGQLGLKVYSIVVKARDAVECERKLIAAVPPRMNFDRTWECPAHETSCEVVWKDFWWRKVAKKVLHPTKPLGFNEIADFVSRNGRELARMTNGCREAVVQQVSDGGFQEHAIINGAVEAVVGYFKSLDC